MTEIATYDFPWGTRPICPLEHERTIGGDGFGGRCCGTADVMVVVESDDDCARHLCEACCEEKCCRVCHAEDVLKDQEACGGCLSDIEMERRANEEMDDRDRRATTIDTRTPADHEMERRQQRRDDDEEREF